MRDLLFIVRLELLLQLLEVAQIDSDRLFADQVPRVLLQKDVYLVDLCFFSDQSWMPGETTVLVASLVDLRAAWDQRGVESNRVF